MLVKEYFPDHEITCKCGCGLMPDEKFVEKLYAMRIIWGKPMIILSGGRCPLHNYEVGGSVNSAHLKGAGDIAVAPEDEFELIKIAQFVGFTGIGIRNNIMLHVDDKHEQPTVWTY